MSDTCKQGPCRLNDANYKAKRLHAMPSLRIMRASSYYLTQKAAFKLS